MSGADARGDVYAQWSWLVEREVRLLERTYRFAFSKDDALGYGYVGLLEGLTRLADCPRAQAHAYLRLRVRGAIVDGARSEGGIRWRLYMQLRQEHEEAPKRVLDELLAAHVDVTAPMASTPEVEVLREERRHILQAALGSLSPADLEVLTSVLDLKEVGDSGAALARRRGTVRSTVHRRHRRVTTRLRHQVERAYG